MLYCNSYSLLNQPPYNDAAKAETHNPLLGSFGIAGGCYRNGLRAQRCIPNLELVCTSSLMASCWRHNSRCPVKWVSKQRGVIATLYIKWAHTNRFIIKLRRPNLNKLPFRDVTCLNFFLSIDYLFRMFEDTFDLKSKYYFIRFLISEHNMIFWLYSKFEERD